MNLTKFSIDRPIGITMVIAFFVVLGLFSFYRIGVELLPALNTPYVTVSISYPGANADSVEQQVVKPAEDALSSVSNLKHMTSTASYGQARITLELDFSANADAAAIDATKKINAIRGSLPDGIDEPVVIKRDVNATPIMYVAVQSSHSLDDIYSKTENDFQDVLQQADGVSEIELNGGRDKEIAVEIDKDKLIHYDMTLAEVVKALKAENVLMPSGTIYSSGTTTDVRVKAQYADESELSQIQVTNAKGAKIPITAVASIKRQDQRVTRYARVNGDDAVVMAIYKNSDANVVNTVDNVTKKLDELRQDNQDYTFTVTNESASYIRNSLHNTLQTLIEGLCTTGLVLFFFLRGWRSTLAVMIAIPTSLISTFFAMYLAGFTFNMMSLMGMALCIDCRIGKHPPPPHAGRSAKISSPSRPVGNRHGCCRHHPLRCRRFPAYCLHDRHGRSVFQTVRPDHRLCHTLFPLRFLYADADAGIAPVPPGPENPGQTDLA